MPAIFVGRLLPRELLAEEAVNERSTYTIMSTTKKLNLDMVNVEVRSESGVHHLSVSSLLNTDHSPVVELKALIGENGEVLVAPVEFWQEATNALTTSASNWVRSNIGEQNMLSYAYSYSMGVPDWRCRRRYTEVHCLRQAVLSSKKDEGFKKLYAPFLKQVQRVLLDLDKNGYVDDQVAIAPGALRTPYALSNEARKAKSCKEETVDTEAVAALQEEPAVSSVVADVEPALDEVLSEELVATEPAQDVTPEEDLLAVASEIFAATKSLNTLVAALQEFFRVRSDVTSGPEEHVRTIASAWVSVKAAAKAIGEEVSK